MRDLLGGFVEKPEDFRGAEVVLGAAFAEQPFYESFLADPQERVGKTVLEFLRAQVKLENAFAGIAPESRRNIFHRAMGKPEFHCGAGAEPLAIGALFAFGNGGGKTAPQAPAVAQHSGRQTRSAIDRAFRVRRRPDVQVRARLIRGEMKRAPAIDIETVGAPLRLSFREGKENVEELHNDGRIVSRAAPQCSSF